jgi:response regulator RpfG family c-di-GMP phosphodiesterase
MSAAPAPAPLISFPASVSPALAQAEAEYPEAGVARILVVDDEEVIALGLAETLSREGYQACSESSAVQALHRLREEPFAVILTDQRMPELSGLEFLSQAKQIQPDATRILMTGVLNLNTVIEAINQGEIYRFIVKPWLREELLVTVKNGAQRYELIRRNAELQRATQAMNQRLAELNVSLERQVAREAEQNRRLAELNTALEQNLHRSVELCLKTMETFHPTLGEQARKVHEICRGMAEDLKLPTEERQVLEFAAYLHDIGLMGVPRRLIRLWQRQSEMLNNAEVKMIQQHPILGEQLVGFIHHLAGVGKVIRSHHERYDGNGFPDGLAGDDIPWLVRLLAVAASYVESNLDDLGAVEGIRQGSGEAYDPEAVRAFLRRRPRGARPRKEREVLLSELAPGMVLAKGIYTTNGLLLIPEGQTLNERLLDTIRNHNRVSPIRHELLVYC